MKIVLDAMGGDNAPDANIKGAVNAINKVKAEVVLVGKEEVIRSKIKEFYGKEMEEISDRLKIRNATETIEMCDTPTIAIKHKKDSSMVVGFKMLKEDEGDVFISAGNSGALLTGATLLVGRIKGIDRPALAGILPAYKSQLLLIDAGSNTNCKPINLLQFAQMSSIYLRNTYGIQNPAIGLLNIGTEETKGNELTKESYNLLKEKSKELNINCIKGNTLCNDCFDGYLDDIDSFIARFPKDLNIIACEMEAFALFYMAKYFNKEAACLLTVVDSHYKNQESTPEERERSLNDMIKIALESI